MNDEVAILNKMFNIDTPLGPIETPNNDLRDARSIHDLLFDSQTSLSRRNHDLQPWVIVGRRGSGKTAFLHQRYIDCNYEYHVKINSAQVFQTVCRSIENILLMSKHKHAPFVENVSHIWKSIFITSAISTICKPHRNKSKDPDDVILQSMINFLNTLNINKQSSPNAILKLLINKSKEIAKKLNLNPETDIEDIFINHLEIGEAEELINEFCENNSRKVFILIDSVELFPVDNSSMDIAASALLHALTYFRSNLSPINICFCIPSEIYYHFSRNISSNPEKDFSSKITLRWEPYDLLRMSALRFSKYVEIHHKKRSNLGIEPEKFTSRKDVYEFWWKYLPRRIENNFGELEDSFAYILRHTQLLPRHVIGIFNEIMRLSLSRDEEENIYVTQDDIKRGVKLASDSICEGILSSYSLVHPYGHDLCENMLPNMKNSFSMREFKVFHKRYGLGVVRNNLEALHVFKNLGIFGVVNNESKIYCIGEFEYTQPSAMPISDDDVFCIHPAFAGRYRVGRSKEGIKSEREVYPHGTDLDEDLAA